MTWEQIAELCQTELQQLRVGGPDILDLFPDAQNVPSMFLAHERYTNDAVERAVREFAANRTWPALTPDEKVMLSFRLDFAVTVATLLAQQPAPWTDTEDFRQSEERIGWLMLFAWENEGFSALHDNLRLLLSRERTT